MNKRTFLSWDVGISNLAFCLIDKENNKFKIKKWGVINLSNKKNICDEKYKKGNKCTSIAMYSFTINNSTKYYCKRHSKNFKIKKPEILKLDKDNICKHIINNKRECGKKAKKIIKDNGESYCTVHLKSHIRAIEKKNSLQKIIYVNSNKIPIDILIKKLFFHLDEHLDDFMMVNDILIENQPTLKNPTMKSIASGLMSYFILRGITDKTKNNSLIETISYICPGNKLKMSNKAIKKNKEYKKQIKELKNEINKLDKNNKNEIQKINKKISKIDRTIYNMTKELGKRFCKELIKDDKINLEFINKHKKQDDLCDAYLQAYYKIMCKPNVPKEISDKLDKVFDNYYKEILKKEETENINNTNNKTNINTENIKEKIQNIRDKYL